MKAKHFYLICFVLVMGGLLLSIIVMAKAVWVSPHIEEKLIRVPSIPPLAPLSGLIEKTNRFEALLSSLAQPRATEKRKARLAAFGYRGINQMSKLAKGAKMKLSREFRHSVSFAFCGENKNFCVVDGTFYPQGATLITGGRILKILPQKVMIEEGNVRKWFPVGAGIEDNDSDMDHKQPGENK